MHHPVIGFLMIRPGFIVVVSYIIIICVHLLPFLIRCTRATPSVPVPSTQQQQSKQPCPLLRPTSHPPRLRQRAMQPWPEPERSRPQERQRAMQPRPLLGHRCWLRWVLEEGVVHLPSPLHMPGRQRLRLTPRQCRLRRRGLGRHRQWWQRAMQPRPPLVRVFPRPLRSQLLSHLLCFPWV